MARDIEEFLRRAAERRQQQKNQAGQPAPPPQQPPPRQQPPRQQPRRDRRPPIEEVEVEIVEPTIVSRPNRGQANKSKANRGNTNRGNANEAPIVRQKLQSEMRRESVSEHVSRHIDTARISEPSQRLGQRIVSVHDQVDAAVHRHLDHDISIVDDKPTITDDPRPGIVGADISAAAGELLKMLSQPKTIRQAILLSEILNRPNFEDD